jgi:hypothetical protein
MCRTARHRTALGRSEWQVDSADTILRHDAPLPPVLQRDGSAHSQKYQSASSPSRLYVAFPADNGELNQSGL